MSHVSRRPAFAALFLNTALGACTNSPLSGTSFFGQSAGTKNEVARPGLIVTDAPAPQVIYNPGSRDVASGSSFSPMSTAHIETLVTRKAGELSSDLDQLRAGTEKSHGELLELQARNDQRAADYYAAVAAVSAELQGGTTPGNPLLVDRWNVAQQKLTALSEDNGKLTDLVTDLNNQASRGTYLLEATQNAFSISGAVPEDHKKLTVVQDGVEQVIAQINRLLAKSNDEITHHAAFLQSERANMQTLSLGIANGELYGKNLTNSLFRKAVDGDKGLYLKRGGTSAESAVPGMRKPLVIIRFDRSDVEYEHALYAAVDQALDKYPDSRFDLVAVSNLEGNAAELALSSAEARKNGERVLRSLQNMGLPLDRVRLSAASSKNVLNSEIHLYLQ